MSLKSAAEAAIDRNPMEQTEISTMNLHIDHPRRIIASHRTRVSANENHSRNVSSPLPVTNRHPCGNLLSHATGSFGEKRHPAKSALHESSPTLARARSNAVTRRSTKRVFAAFNYMDGRWPKGAALVLEIRRAVSQPGSKCRDRYRGVLATQELELERQNPGPQNGTGAD